MSRSFKKFPHFDDYSRNHTPYAKRLANKTVRAREREMLDDYEKGEVEKAESLDLGNGSDYKNVFETYSIEDYKYTVYFLEDVHNLPSDYLRKGIMK